MMTDSNVIFPPKLHIVVLNGGDFIFSLLFLFHTVTMAANEEPLLRVFELFVDLVKVPPLVVN